MFPQLTPPTDSLYKFLAVGGLVLVVTVLYLQQRMQAELTSASFHVYEQQLGQAESEAQLDASHQRLMYALRSFYNKAGIDSEKEIDTTGSGALVWHRVTSGPKELVSESNALGDSLRKFLGHERLVQQKRNLFDLERSRYEAEKESARWIIDVLWFGLVFGFALSILGFLLWYKKIQRYNDQILRNEFEKVNREYYCQSCGMRLDMDLAYMAQDIEYKKRTPYCTHCYVNGAFTNGEISMRDMMKQMEERAKVLGVPWLTRQIWKLDLYKLERWRRSFTWK